MTLASWLFSLGAEFVRTSAYPGWLGGGYGTTAVLVTVLGAGIGSWAVVRREYDWLYLATAMWACGVLAVLAAFSVHQVDAYLTPIALWSAGAAFALYRTKDDASLARVADVGAVLFGVLAPVGYALYYALGTGSGGLDHAVSAILMSVAAVAAGVVGRVRAYFWAGLAGVVLTALGLSLRSVYSIPFVVALVAVTGVALIVFGAFGKRRRKSLDFIAGRGAYSDWR